MKLNRCLVLFFSSFLLFVSLSINAQISFGKAELINDGWMFQLRDEADAFKSEFDDKS